jgi:hypothetical protein
MAKATKTTTSKPATIPVTTTFANDGERSIYSRLVKYQREKGLSHVQDVVRLAVANLLDKAGV